MTQYPRDPAQSPPRVLVIDDDHATRVLLKKVLTQSGFDVDLATGGFEGMKLALTQEYEAILLDLVMPQPDGVAVLRRISSSQPTLLRSGNYSHRTVKSINFAFHLPRYGGKSISIALKERR